MVGRPPKYWRPFDVSGTPAPTASPRSGPDGSHECRKAPAPAPPLDDPPRARTRFFRKHLFSFRNGCTMAPAVGACADHSGPHATRQSAWPRLSRRGQRRTPRPGRRPPRHPPPIPPPGYHPTTPAPHRCPDVRPASGARGMTLSSSSWPLVSPEREWSGGRIGRLRAASPRTMRRARDVAHPTSPPRNSGRSSPNRGRPRHAAPGPAPPPIPSRIAARKKRRGVGRSHDRPAPRSWPGRVPIPGSLPRSPGQASPRADVSPRPGPRPSPCTAGSRRSSPCPSSRPSPASRSSAGCTTPGCSGTPCPGS